MIGDHLGVLVVDPSGNRAREYDDESSANERQRPDHFAPGVRRRKRSGSSIYDEDDTEPNAVYHATRTVDPWRLRGLAHDLARAGQPELLVIEFQAGKRGYSFRHMRRAEILEEARAYGVAISRIVSEALARSMAASSATANWASKETTAPVQNVGLYTRSPSDIPTTTQQRLLAATSVDGITVPGTPLAARRDAIAAASSRAAGGGATPGFFKSPSDPARATPRPAAPPPPAPPASFTGAGSVIAERRGRAQTGAVTSYLQSRDLRVIDSTFEISRQPVVLVRRHAIVVNLPPIRVIILPDKAWLLPEDGADEDLAPILSRLSNPAVMDGEGGGSEDGKPHAAGASGDDGTVTFAKRTLAPGTVTSPRAASKAANGPATIGLAGIRVPAPLSRLLQRTSGGSRSRTGLTAFGSSSPRTPAFTRPLLGGLGQRAGSGSASSASGSQRRLLVASTPVFSPAAGTAFVAGTALAQPLPPPLLFAERDVSPRDVGLHTGDGIEATSEADAVKPAAPGNGTVACCTPAPSPSSSPGGAIASGVPVDELPFEFVVLETVMLATMAHLKRELAGLEGMAGRTVEMLTQQRGGKPHLFDALRRAKRACNDFTGRVKAVHRVLSEVRQRGT